MNYFEMKKRAFMSIVNALKGFIRKVSGTPPITLPYCVDEDSLISYSLGLEDTRVNLYNPTKKTSYTASGITITYNSDGTYTVNGTATADVYFHIGAFPIKSGEFYYCSGGTPEAMIGYQMRIDGVNMDTVVSKGDIVLLPRGTLSNEYEDLNPVIWIVSGRTVDNVIVKPMISHIETDEYVPYVEPETLGDKTKNLLDITKYKTQYNPKFTLENGVLDLTYYTWTHNLYYEISGLKPSTNYTFSMLANKQAQMYYNDVNWFAATTKTADGYYTCSQTIKSSATGTMKIAFKYGNDDVGFSCKAWDLMLVEGTTAREYEPYGYKIPIKMSGKNLATAKDVYAKADRYSEVVLDGRECVKFWDSVTTQYTGVAFKENTQYTVSFEAKTTISSSENTSPSFAFTFFYTDKTRGNIVIGRNQDWRKYTLTSNKDKTVQAIGVYTNNFVNWIHIDVNTFQLEEGTTVTDYEPYINSITTNIILDEPLIAGNVLEYPKDDIPKLPTVKGTTIYSVETEVQPSNMSVEYYATRKGE